MKGWTLALLGLVGWCSAAEAAQELRLSLGDALEMAQGRNPQLRSMRLSQQVMQQGVAAAAARFGRHLTASASHLSQRSPSISALEGVQTASSSTMAVGLGLQQELPTGGRIGVTFDNWRLSSNAAYRIIDPVYQSQLGLEFTQPLLRGRGDVNHTDLRLARAAEQVADLDLSEGLRNLQADVSRAYWDLHYAAEDLAVQQQLAGGARRLLETVRARVAMGAGPRSDILQTEVGVARRDEAVIIAEGAARQAEDRLKSLTGLDQDAATWDQRILPTTMPPDEVALQIDLRSGIERGIQLHPQLQRQALELTQLDLQLAAARDAARVQLDLRARVGLSGIGATYADNAEVLGELEGRSWNGGVELRLPLGDDPQQHRLRQSQLQRQRGEIDLERQRLVLVNQVREQYRMVGINSRRARVADLTVQLSAQSLHEQEERLALGLATVREVLDAQDDLAQARASRLQAVVEFRKARIEWQRLTGGPIGGTDR